MSEEIINIDESEIEKYVYEEALRNFAFLYEEYSFSKPQIKITYYNVKVFFVAKNMAIECIYDKFDKIFSITIVRTDWLVNDMGGHFVDGIYIDNKDEKGRTGLAYIRDFMNIVFGMPFGEPFLKKKQDIREKITLCMEKVARELKEFGSEILKDSANLFELYDIKKVHNPSTFRDSNI